MRDIRGLCKQDFGSKTKLIVSSPPLLLLFPPYFHNMNLLTNGRHTQDVTETRRNDYNELWPHSSLDYQTPAEFAAHWRDSSRHTASFPYATAEPADHIHNQQVFLTAAGA